MGPNSLPGLRPIKNFPSQRRFGLDQNSSSGPLAPLKTQHHRRGGWTQQPAQPPIRQLLGAANTQTAHPATFSTAPAHQLLGSANAETTPARAAAAAERSDPTQHAKGRTGDRPGPRKGATTRRNVTRGGAGPTPALGGGGCMRHNSVPLCPLSVARHVASYRGFELFCRIASRPPDPPDTPPRRVRRHGSIADVLCEAPTPPPRAAVAACVRELHEHWAPGHARRPDGGDARRPPGGRAAPRPPDAAAAGVRPRPRDAAGGLRDRRVPGPRGPLPSPPPGALPPDPTRCVAALALDLADRARLDYGHNSSPSRPSRCTTSGSPPHPRRPRAARARRGRRGRAPLRGRAGARRDAAAADGQRARAARAPGAAPQGPGGATATRRRCSRRRTWGTCI